MDPGESYPFSIQHCQTQVIHYPTNTVRPRLSTIQPKKSDLGYPLSNQHSQTQVIHYPINTVRSMLSIIQPTQSDPAYQLSNQYSQTQVIHYPSNIVSPRLSIIQPTQSNPWLSIIQPKRKFRFGHQKRKYYNLYCCISVLFHFTAHCPKVIQISAI